MTLRLPSITHFGVDNLNETEKHESNEEHNHEHKAHEHTEHKHHSTHEKHHAKRKHSNSDEGEISISKTAIWQTIAVVFLLLFVVSLFTTVFDGLVGKSGNGSSNLNAQEEVKTKSLDYINTNLLQDGTQASISNVTVENGMYKLIVTVGTQSITSYVSPDKKMFFPSALALEEPLAPSAPSQPQAAAPVADIPKSDRPQVELFVWSYCPYGVQAEGPISTVAQLLGDSADFEIVPYHDGHGAHETQENKIQSCIQKLEPDKYWAYAGDFVANIYPKCGASRDIDCDKTESIKLMKSLGIDSDAVFACVESEGTSLNQAAVQLAQNNDVTGSPTLIVNGVKVQVARNAEAFKTAICSAYNVPPDECGSTLDSTAAATAGNC